MNWMLDVGGVAVSVPAAVLCGAAVGSVAGLFGVGGGFLLVPSLHVVLGIPLPMAVGASLCQMVGTALSTFLRQRRQKQAEIRFDLLMLGGAMVGTEAGARTLQALLKGAPVHVGGYEFPLARLVLYGLYSALLLYVAQSLIRGKSRVADLLGQADAGPLAKIRFGPTVPFPTAGLPKVSVLVVAYIGFAMGYLSGLLGIGGGVALMPIMLYGFGFPIRLAAGTGVMVLATSSAAGTFSHALKGNVHLGLAMALLAGSTLAAQFGARLSAKLPAQAMRRIFAGLLLLTIMLLGYDAVRKAQPSGGKGAHPPHSSPAAASASH